MNKWTYRASLVLIFLAHMLLLWWLLYVLRESGLWPMDKVFYHFVGLSIAGGLLIRVCAWWFKRKYIQERREKRA